MDLFLDLLREILRSALRIEKKVDEVLSYAKSKGHQTKPMHYRGEPCPLCQRKVEYMPAPVSEGEFQMIRICGCSPQQTQLNKVRR